MTTHLQPIPLSTPPITSLARITKISRYGNQVPAFNLPRQFLDFLGNIPRTKQTNILIEGSSGCGKSTFSLMLASTLAKFGRVFYHSTEEGPDSGTFRHRINLLGCSMHNIESINRQEVSLLKSSPETYYNVVQQPLPASVLYFQGCYSPEAVYERLGVLAEQHHPDVGGDAVIMQAILEEMMFCLEWWGVSANSPAPQAPPPASISEISDKDDLRAALATGRYRFAFLDSVNMYDDYKDELILPVMNEFPSVNFICIAQHTKDGKYRGSGKWKHKVDIHLQAQKEEAKETQTRIDWQGKEVHIEEGEVMRILHNEKNRLSPKTKEFFIFKDN